MLFPGPVCKNSLYQYSLNTGLRVAARLSRHSPAARGPTVCARVCVSLGMTCSKSNNHDGKVKLVALKAKSESKLRTCSFSN